MNWRKKLILLLLIAFTLLQFVRPARNQGGQDGELVISKIYSMPDTVQAIFKNACFDCHSNNTDYPWYANIQPMGWILARDIENGKAKLNFSELGSLSRRRQISKLQEALNRIKDGTMPLQAYQLMHKNARLTKEEKELIIDWIENTIH